VTALTAVGRPDQLKLQVDRRQSGSIGHTQDSSCCQQTGVTSESDGFTRNGDWLLQHAYNYAMCQYVNASHGTGSYPHLNPKSNYNLFSFSCNILGTKQLKYNNDTKTSQQYKINPNEGYR